VGVGDPETVRRRRGPLRRALRIVALVLLVIALFVLSWGTTATVTPPAAPEHPVTALLIADERHRGVLLPSPDGGFVEFGFGDWDYYALGRTDWYRLPHTVLWPTSGTLSRRAVAAGDPAAVRAALPWAEFQELLVARAAAGRLLGMLERDYAARRHEEQSRPAWNMTFVPWSRSYWFLDNCNHAVADWLRDLGCEVSWVPLLLDLRVR
jgi:hypothetical protein